MSVDDKRRDRTLLRSQIHRQHHCCINYSVPSQNNWTVNISNECETAVRRCDVLCLTDLVIINFSTKRSASRASLALCYSLRISSVTLIWIMTRNLYSRNIHIALEHIVLQCNILNFVVCFVVTNLCHSLCGTLFIFEHLHFLLNNFIYYYTVFQKTSPFLLLR